MSEADQAEHDREALEAFVVNNADLERLEALLDRFNIFEAVGMERQEIRHSKFLAFLLDPNESHGMGDAFEKRLLQRAVMDSPNAPAPVTPIELSLWDFGQMDVRQEWQHIDIFLLDERNRLAVIIENKIGTGEHGDQLDRYYEAVREQYPDYRLLALYLTPGGDEPSHPEYLPVDYRAVCEILDGLAKSRASVTEPDLRVLITHYTEMLRRHIVGDSEIARLSQQIYQKHQRAIDLIYEHRFAQREAIRKLLTKLIKEAPDLSYNTRYTHYPAGEWISFRRRRVGCPISQCCWRIWWTR
ncbi:MAG: PD-(D/E)XK nuclease family protein [Rubrobacteraceae bacterium]